MLISDIAIVIASVAFLITQVHLYRVAKKLIRKSNESWSQAHDEISKVKSDVLAEIERISQKGGREELKPLIGELEDRIGKSFAQFGERITTSLDSFGSSLSKGIEQTISSRTPALLRSGVSPTDAQLEGAASKQAKKIVEAIKGEALSPEIQQIAQFLQAIGKDDLAEKLMENPMIVQMVLRQINADAWLKSRLGQFMGGARAPGNSPSHQGPI